MEAITLRDPYRDPRIRTGAPGLDEVLCDGLTPNRLYLLEGTPGTGKTTLALQFLLAGAAVGEAGLYVTLSETEHELRTAADSHGWSLDALTIFELVPEAGLDPELEQSLLHPADVELGETVRSVMNLVEQLKPRRVVLDSLSELRLLAQNPLRYRRQVLALKHFFSRMHCTVLVLDDRTSEPTDQQLHSIAHGVILLEQSVTGFGAERRRLRIVKMRGIRYRGGYHDFAITRGGLAIYPRLSTDGTPEAVPQVLLTSGIANLDLLLGGGVVPGTTTLLSGPAGVGKTTTTLNYIVAALKRGERAAYFLFDERLPTLLTRSAALGLNLAEYIDSGQLILRQVDPAEMSPGAFADGVRIAVEEDGVRTVVIDSLNAYLHAMPDDKYLLLQMHEMLAYLGQRQVVTLLVLGQHGLLGEIRADVDLSYLADTVILLRFFEAAGEVRKAISVVKTRTTDHERTIREFRIGPDGIVVGDALRGFKGILTGQPTFSGNETLFRTISPNL